MSCSNGKHTHTGWSDEETEQLFALAASAQSCGRPLKAVFDEIAAKNGRRPNSVRNYYYARVKETDEPRYAHQRAFLPFRDEEAELLVEQVLCARASGESVRSCTLRLAGGNDKAMLRYQNKYRALLKNNPALVRRVFERLRQSGRPVLDPYAEGDGRRRAGRPRKQSADLGRMAERLAVSLSRLDGVDAHALLGALYALSSAAASCPAEAGAAGAEVGVRAENDSLRRELVRQHARYKQLLGYFTQLVRINSEFLSLNSVVKVSNLSSYIHDLESNVKSCERAMVESG